MLLKFIGGPEDGKEANFSDPAPYIETPIRTKAPATAFYRLAVYRLNRIGRFKWAYCYDAGMSYQDHGHEG